MAAGARLSILDRPISHISYAVPNIAAAVEHWATTLGAGPFFLIDRVRFDEVSYQGEPAVWEHAAAFGQWGAVCIELQEISEASPPRIAELLVPGPMPVVNHVAYLSETPEADSAELSAAGNALFLHARFGGVEVWFHDTSAILGHAIEIHRNSERLIKSFEMIAAAAREWDGTRPLRPMWETP